MRNLTKLVLLLCTLLYLTSCGGKNNTKQKNDDPKAIQESETTTTAISSTDPASSEVVNYLGTTKVIDFDGVAYPLAWSHPPQGVYYIQEYLPAGQTFEAYEDLFIVDLYKDASVTLKAAVKEKTDWLDQRKKADPTTNYKIKQNAKTNEYIVDLIISEGNVVEWNVIRYAAYEEEGKYAGVKTFTMSKRGYAGMSAFVDKSYSTKTKLVKLFAELDFPEIKLQ